jgi:hypothetical protein
VMSAAIVETDSMTTFVASAAPWVFAFSMQAKQ